MDGTVDNGIGREQAAETLRSLEGIRRRTIEASDHWSVFPLLTFGIASIIAAPFDLLHWKAAPTVALAVATVLAVVTTDLHYRRQAVHVAARRRSLTVGRAVMLAVVLIIFGPVVLGLALFPIAFGGSNIGVFIVFSIAAIVAGRRTKSRALSLTGALSLLSPSFAFFIWSDHWAMVASVLSGFVFLTAALVSRASGRSA